MLISGAPPIPTRNATEPTIVTTGPQTPAPASAMSPDPGIFPIYMRSTGNCDPDDEFFYVVTAEIIFSSHNKTLLYKIRSTEKLYCGIFVYLREDVDCRK